MKTWADVSALSRRFIGGLDRSPLGRFAVPRDVLTEVDTEQRTRALRARGEMVKGYSAFYAFQYAEDFAEKRGVDYYAAESELEFWWHYVGEPLLESPIQPRDEYRDSLSRLYIIAESPVEMHDYFEAGLWDTDFIARCISDGIDAELAKSISM